MAEVAPLPSPTKSDGDDLSEAKDAFPSPAKSLNGFGSPIIPSNGYCNGANGIMAAVDRIPGSPGLRERTSSAASLSSISLAPDAQLDGMKLVLQKELPKISVDRYYQTFWANESNNFFKSWLINQGKTNVEITPWVANGKSVVNPFDGEDYDAVRTVTYSYDRSTSVYSGPVTVTMTQYCKRIRRQRVVLAYTLGFAGMPYGKAFNVHVRWVASRRQKVNLRVQVGICVIFVEQVLVASQIKANSMAETTQMQADLFRSMKQTLGFSKDKWEDDQVNKKEANALTKTVAFIFPFAGGLSSSNDALIKLKEAHGKLARVRSLPLKDAPDDEDEQREHILEEMDTIHLALDAMLLRKYNSQDKLNTQSGKTTHPFLVRILRKLSPRLVQVRNPSAFENKTGNDRLDLQRRDKTLSKMEVIVSSTIPDITLNDFVSVFLTDEQGQNGFYEKWMRDTDRDNIEIGPWEDEDHLASLIVDEFSGESFVKRRTINATFKKGKFLRDGGADVESKQMQEQFFRQDKENRIVFATTTKVANVPFANAFEVHTRWVVTQLHTSDLSVKVGLFVIFKKQALLESKLRAGATKEGHRTQLDLFLKVRTELGKVNEERTQQALQDLQEYLTPTPTFADVCTSPMEVCMPKAQSDFVDSDPVLYEEFENGKIKLRAIDLYLKDCEELEDTEAMKFILGELNVMNDALDNILEYHGEGGAKALAAGSFQN
mmetsp:Transcript_1339/g.3707  ORF Transcript_1339/g.3707 Transcript_1339/m.3707 type:complete len:717 (-) Transcript_1339:156-2306(-)